MEESQKSFSKRKCGRSHQERSGGGVCKVTEKTHMCGEDHGQMHSLVHNYKTLMYSLLRSRNRLVPATPEVGRTCPVSVPTP